MNNESKVKVDVYQMVTDRIIKQMEQGIIPWKKPWSGVRGGAFNRVSKHQYSLINQMLLEHEGEYASFKQWSEVGGKIKKGAKSEIVVFWKLYPITEKDKDGKVITKNIPLLKYLNVFHISQVENVEPLEKPLENINPIEDAEKIVNDYISREHIDFSSKGKSNKAYYAPSTDRIVVPCINQYNNPSDYYSTLFHEIVHSTGAKKRLDRLEKSGLAAFGSEEYSKEELIAEIGSSNLMNIVGIETDGTFKNSVAYLQSWLKVLKDDKKFIVSASGKSEKAVKYIIAGSEA